MWQVDDEAVATFATGLYEELARANEPGRGWIGDAVCRARERIVAAQGQGEPAWAAYALYGSPWRPAW